MRLLQAWRRKHGWAWGLVSPEEQRLLRASGRLHAAWMYDDPELHRQAERDFKAVVEECQA